MLVLTAAGVVGDGDRLAGEPEMRSGFTEDVPGGAVHERAHDLATTGAAVSDPPPPCSTTQATTYFGSL